MDILILKIKSKFNYFKYCKRVVRLFSRPSEDDTIEELEIRRYITHISKDTLEWLKKVNNHGIIKRRYVFVKAEIDSKERILLDIEENLDESSDFSFDEEEEEEEQVQVEFCRGR